MTRSTASHLSLAVAASALLCACQAGTPPAPGLPDDYAPADYIPARPAPVLPAGVTRTDILVRHGCYYVLRDGEPVPLPFAETNRDTGQVSTYDRYCIG